MISRELLDLLVCPETHQRLRLLSAQELESLNGRIATGEMANRKGEPLAEPWEGGLLREDGLVAYPIRHRLPVMLIAESVSMV